MPRTVTLNVPITGTLNGSGNGTLQAGPTAPGVVWYPTSVSISASGSIPTSGTPATCTIYVGSNFVDATYQVTGAASSVISGQSVYPGTYIYAVFANCNPGATATLIINGTMTVPGQ